MVAVPYSSRIDDPHTCQDRVRHHMHHSGHGTVTPVVLSAYTLAHTRDTERGRGERESDRDAPKWGREPPRTR